MPMSNKGEILDVVEGREVRRRDDEPAYPLHNVAAAHEAAMSAPDESAPTLVGREATLDGKIYKIVGSTGFEWTLTPLEFGETIFLTAGQLNAAGVDGAVEPPEVDPYWAPVANGAPSVEDVFRAAAEETR